MHFELVGVGRLHDVSRLRHIRRGSVGDEQEFVRLQSRFVLNDAVLWDPNAD